MLGAKLAADPGLDPILSAVNIPFLGIICQVKEVADGDLEGLQVANIDDPDAISLTSIRKVHLLSSLLQLNGVDPLVISWVADIVEMVVYSCASHAVRLILERQSANVAPVVVSPEQSDIVRY